MKKIFASLVILLAFLDGIGQVCINEFDVTEFSMEGSPDASWEVVSPTEVINRAYIYPATFFVNQESMINVLVKGTLSVETGGDKDFIGIVFGYQQPTELADDNFYDFFLFDWKAETEDYIGFRAFEGFRLSRYYGNISKEDQKRYFWGTTDDPIRRILEEKYGDTMGWRPFEKYQFELLHTSNQVRLKINDQMIFEKEGCFSAGKFGFYCMSQDLARFENFTFQNMIGFIPDPKSACIGETVKFNCFDLNCSPFPEFVESVLWDFGDGQTSSEINAEHAYRNSGTYPVSIIVTTTAGCVDTITDSYIVKPGPVVNLGNDTIITICSSVTLDAKNTGSLYLWSTGDTTQSILLEEISENTIIWVQVISNGCKATDSILIEVADVQQELYFPNAFTPDGDGNNDVFAPIGNLEAVAAYQLIIYNRWGQQIFETSDPHQGWNGSLNSRPLTYGTYIYKVTYRIDNSCIVGKDFSKQGTISLIK
ncbi:gliding motility-associated C-terminal domain-containing protein [bacterium]|nr:gliding motility-associated C-terminal domain-containing protein [bacterium]